ncbi:MAG: hypothetical protein ACRDU5_00960 [Mycobacterium sp.]
MTTVQDWLNIRPADPGRLKALICGALRGLTAEEPAEAAGPALIRPGVERC